MTRSQLLGFLEPLTVELTNSQKERLAQLLQAYFRTKTNLTIQLRQQFAARNQLSDIPAG